MKAIGGFGLLLFLVVAVYWLSASAGGGQDEEIQFQVAFGKPGPNGIEMHVVVPVIMANRGNVAKDGKLLRNRNEWVAAHFELKDGSGDPVKLEHRNNSNVIQQREVVGTQEFFLVGTLKENQSYTFDYVPDPLDPGRYRNNFSAPTSAAKVRMVSWKTAK